MSDQCGKCELRNNIAGCLREDCWQHDNWLVFALEEQRENLRAQLAEAQKENEELKTHAYAVAKDLRKRMNEQDASWQETAQHLLERAEKAEADNAALCAKLKLIEGIFIKYGKNIDYIINHSLGINKELWQAIKAAYEGNDGLF